MTLEHQAVALVAVLVLGGSILLIFGGPRAVWRGLRHLRDGCSGPTTRLLDGHELHVLQRCATCGRTMRDERKPTQVFGRKVSHG